VRSSRQATVPTKFVRLLSMTSKCEYTDFLISSDDDVAFESNPNVVSFISSSSASDWKVSWINLPSISAHAGGFEVFLGLPKLKVTGSPASFDAVGKGYSVNLMLA
jgi:hypothetical protein